MGKSYWHYIVVPKPHHIIIFWANIFGIKVAILSFLYERCDFIVFPPMNYASELSFSCRMRLEVMISSRADCVMIWIHTDCGHKVIENHCTYLCDTTFSVNLATEWTWHQLRRCQKCHPWTKTGIKLSHHPSPFSTTGFHEIKTSCLDQGCRITDCVKYLLICLKMTPLLTWFNTPAYSFLMGFCGCYLQVFFDTAWCTFCSS